MNFLKIKITILTCFKDIIGYGKKSIFFSTLLSELPIFTKKLPFLHALTNVNLLKYCWFISIAGASIFTKHFVSSYNTMFWIYYKIIIKNININININK